MGNIEDANRTTTYVGTVELTGDLAGVYALDIHAQATGSTLWTCGTINDDEIGFGACY
jgi:hypothetical protein